MVTIRIIWRLGPDYVLLAPLIAVPLWMAITLISVPLFPPKLVRVGGKTICDRVVLDYIRVLISAEAANSDEMLDGQSDARVIEDRGEGPFRRR